jgi:hypothetical protein
MRARHRLGLGAAGLSLLVGATGAFAVETDPEEWVPNTPTTPVYLTCGEPSKEYVVGALVNDDEGVPTWSEDEPASVTTGAGCGKVDEPLFNGTRPRSPYQFTFAGLYTGNLDTLNVTLYTTDAGMSRLTDGAMKLAVRATVDGMSLFGVTENTGTTGTVVFSPAEGKVTATPVATGDTGAVRAVTFSITGIDLLLPDDDTTHYVQLDVRDDANLDNHVWMWGAAEAPSGLVFTPEQLSPAQMKAQRRTSRKQA